MIDKKNRTYNAVPTSVTLSVPHDADVVIGQSFYLYITIMFNGNIPSEFNVHLEVINGIIVDSITKIIPVPEVKNAAYLIAYLTIADENTLKPGEKVAYKLNIPNFNMGKIHYTANLIIPNSLRLSVNKHICEIPKTDIAIDNQNKNFILYTAKLKNSSGNFLKNTPIQISAIIKDNLNGKVIVTTNPDDDFHQPVCLHPINEPEQVIIPINSDRHGKVSFRVYPVKAQPVTLRLGSQLPGLDVYAAAPIVYMLSPRPIDPRVLLPRPVISALNEGKLKASGDNYTFDVTIAPYIHEHNDDSIIFFLDEKPILPIRMIANSNPPEHSFELYYDMFPRNKLIKLNYVIASIAGNDQYSNTLPVTYIGGGDNKPSNNITRVFDKPIVYASWANPNSQPPLNKSDERFIIECGSTINSPSIAGYQEEGNDGYGLFIKVVGTNDLTDKDKPKFYDTIHFTMYINGDYSDDLSNDDTYKQIYKPFSTVISDTPDYEGSKTSTTVISIKHDLLVNFASNSKYGTPMIYFEYYIIDNEGIRTYSNYYYGQIETVGD